MKTKLFRFRRRRCRSRMRTCRPRSHHRYGSTTAINVWKQNKIQTYKSALCRLTRFLCSTFRPPMCPTLRSYKSCKHVFIFSLHQEWICWAFLLNCDLASLFTFSRRLAEKELQRKSLEDSLNAERSSGASRETNMQVCLPESLCLDLQTFTQPGRKDTNVRNTLFPVEKR